MTRSNSKIIRDSLTKISISSYSIQAKMFCGQVSRPRLYRLKNEFRVTLFDQCCRFHKVDWLGIGKLESLLSQNLSGIVKNCRTHAERIKIKTFHWNQFLTYFSITRIIKFNIKRLKIFVFKIGFEYSYWKIELRYLYQI